MLAVLLLIATAQLNIFDDKSYVICICSHCTSSPESKQCDDYVSSNNPSFFEILRGKIKSRANVLLYLTDKNEITLDLNNFGKYEQTIRFSANDQKSIFNLYYSNSRQYMLLDLASDNVQINFINDDIESKKYDFTLGSFVSTSSSKVNFEVPWANTMKINIEYLSTSAKSISSVDEIIITQNKENVFYMEGENEIKFGDKNFVFSSKNNKETTVKIPEKSEISFEWKLDTGNWYDSKTTLNFYNITKINELPHIKILNVRELSFKGTLPNIEKGVAFIDVIHPYPTEKTNSYNVSIKTDLPQLPINVYAPLINIILTQKSIIQGIINSTMPSEEYSVFISSDVTEKTEIQFEKQLVGRVSAINQFLEILINEIVIPKERKSGTPGSPVSFGFDLLSCTKFIFKKITDYSEIPAESYCFFSHINRPVSNEERKKIGPYVICTGTRIIFNFKQGTKMIHFREDIESRENSIIHGFNNQASCLFLVSFMSALKLSFTIDLNDLPGIVCYGYNCKKNGYSVYTTYSGDINQLVQKNLFFEGLKQLTMVFSDSFPYNSYFNMSELDKSIESVIIKGIDKYDVRIAADVGVDNIKTISFLNINLCGVHNNKISVPNVNVDLCTFDQNMEMNFINNTVIYIDESSMNKLPSVGFYPHLVLKVNGLLGIYLYPGSYSFIDQVSSGVRRYNFPYDIIGEFNITSLKTSETNIGVTLDMEIIPEEGRQIRGFNINIICNYSSSIRLHNDWKNANFSQYVHIYHIAEIDMLYEMPHQGDQIEISGYGQVSVSVIYGKTVEMCVSYNDLIWDYEECIADVFMNQTMFSELFPKIMAKKDAYKAVVRLYGFGEPDQIFNVSTDMLNNYDITFRSSIDEDIANIELYQIDGITDIEFSFLTLKNTTLSISGDKEEFLFGALTLDYCDINEKVKQYSIKVEDLTCKYIELQKFKNVTITNNLIVSGEKLPEMQTDVYFIPDEDAHDLKATIPYSPSILVHEITIGSDEIILGTITFHLHRSSNYDGLFSLKGEFGVNNARLIIKHSEESEITKMPKITFEYREMPWPDRVPTVFEFVGQWQDVYDTIFQINCYKQAHIELEDIIPLELRIDTSFACHINVTAKGENSGITGPVGIASDTDKYNDFGSICVNTTLPSQKRVNFTIMKASVLKYFDGIQGTALQLSSPNIDLYIKRIDIIENRTSFLPMKLSLDDISASAIHLEMYSGQINISQNILIECNIESMYDPATLRYIHENVQILTFPMLLKPVFGDGYSITVSFYNSNHPVHGFTGNQTVVGILDENDYQKRNVNVSLTPIKDPSLIPFSIEYTDGYSIADLVISPKNNISIMKSIQNYIPRVAKVTIFIAQSMRESYPLDLPNIQTIFKTIDIRGGGNLPDFYFNIPTMKVLNLSFLNINPIGVPNRKSGNILYAKSIKMTNCNFGKSSFLIKTSSCDRLDLDADSLGQLIDDNIIDTKYRNPVSVRDSNIIEFNQKGWIVSENGLPKIELLVKSMPYAEFQSSQLVQLLVSSGVKVLNPVDLMVYPDQESKKIEIALGEGWKHVKDSNNFRVNTFDFDAILTTCIYPIPNIFYGNSAKYQINFGLPEEEISKNFELTIEDGFVYSESRTFDMSSVQVSLRFVKATNIIFSGNNVKFVLTGKNAILKIGVGTVKPGTELTLSDSQVSNNLILDKDVIVNAGTITFVKGSKLTLYWNDIRFPEMSFTTYSPPSEINIQYDGYTIDHNEFNKNLYKIPFRIFIGNFSCSDFMNLKFISSIPYFNSGSPEFVFESICENRGYETILTVIATKPLSVEDGDDSGKGGKDNKGIGLGPAPVVAIIIAVAVFLASIIALIVYRSTKKKYEMLIARQVMKMSIETTEGSTIGQYRPNEEEDSTVY